MYKTKVSGACKQDEDLLGEKFLYNRDNDIVLLFNDRNLDTAYCYKRADLSRLVKNGYKQDNTSFRYIIVPHTNQYIVNPEEILNSRWHSFILETVQHRDRYRRDYPTILYRAKQGNDPIFEQAPEIGDETVEEKIDFIPSEQYLETERKMREIRERRPVIEEKEEAPSISISNDPEDIDTFNRYKTIYDRYEPVFIQKKEMYLDPEYLNSILFTDIWGEIPPISRTEVESSEIPRGLGEDSVWINEARPEPDLRIITWYLGDKIHRINKPAKIYIYNEDGVINHVHATWYLEGAIYNGGNVSAFDTYGYIGWDNVPDDDPFATLRAINFVEKFIDFSGENGELAIRVNFDEEIFEDIETRGKITYYNEDGNINEIVYIQA